MDGGISEPTRKDEAEVEPCFPYYILMSSRSTAAEVLRYMPTYNYRSADRNHTMGLRSGMFVEPLLWGFFIHICWLGFIWFDLSAQRARGFASLLQQIPSLRFVRNWWCACLEWMLFKSSRLLLAVKYPVILVFMKGFYYEAPKSWNVGLPPEVSKRRTWWNNKIKQIYKVQKGTQEINKISSHRDSVRSYKSFESWTHGDF